MGQKSSAPKRHRHYQVEMSGIEKSELVGNEASTPQQEVFYPEVEFIDLPLVNVDDTTLKQTKRGEEVDVRGFGVFTRKGLLGEIPHSLRDNIKTGNYKSGVVWNVDKPIVRLFRTQYHQN